MASSYLPALLLLVLLCRPDDVAAVQRGEMDSMLTALRSNGYSLFSNAIVTSDLLYELVDGGDSSFTFFAPTDSSLFALDMVNSASDYTTTLRCHIIPQRLSILGLRRLRSGSTLRTLAADHDLRVESHQSTASDEVITVDGINVVVPGLFYGRNIAVHGLRGILNCGSHAKPQPVLVAPPESPNTTVDSSSVPRSQPPETINPAHTPHLEANLTVHKDSSHNLTVGKNSSHSPPNARRFKRSPPSMNSSDEDNSSDHSPTGNHNLTPSPYTEISDFIDPPNVAPAEYPKVTSPSPLREIHDGFSPVYSPEMRYLPPEIPSAFGTWTDWSTTPSSSPMSEIEPPEAEFSENDDPTFFPPSPSIRQSYRERHKALLIENAELLRYTSVISPEDLAGTMETVPESLRPSDEKLGACPATDESTHARIPRGFVYTNQHGTSHITAC